MARQEKDDQKPLMFNKIFVTYNRYSDMVEDDFKKHFSPFGEIIKVHCQIDKATNKPKGYCFIHYSKTSEACRAMEEMNDTRLEDNPKPIRVHIAQDKKDNLECDVDTDVMMHRIFIRHKKSQNQEELKEYFEQFGEVTWMYVIKDKVTKENKGSAFIKFYKQSDAATAMEECDPDYRPRWADVRSLNHSTPRNVGGALNDRRMDRRDQGHGGRGGGHGGGHGMMDMGGMGGMSGMGGMDMGMMPDREYIGPKKIINTNKLEALVPAQMTQDQVTNLFNIAPGLEGCNLDSSTGIVKLQYINSTCAGYAMERLDGLDIFGQAIAVRISKPVDLQSTAAQLQAAMSNLQSQPGNTNQLHQLMQSLQKVTEALAAPQDTEKKAVGDEMVPWCSIPLPCLKPMTENSRHVAKLFIVTLPDPVPSDMLSNALCRFGNLIGCGYAPGQRFAFANFGSQESSQAAIDHLNMCKLFYNNREFTMKVEMSKLQSKPEHRARNDSENEPIKKRSKWD